MAGKDAIERTLSAVSFMVRVKSGRSVREKKRAMAVQVKKRAMAAVRVKKRTMQENEDLLTK